MEKNFLKSCIQNASFNIIFQIVFRCLTFVLNAFVLRYVGQAVIGVMNVRLLLLESTLLFLSREAFRRACLSKTMEHNWPRVINLIWLTLPLCQIFAMIFGYIWLYLLTSPSEDITAHYSIGVWSICISCLIEMCAEPVFLVAQAFLFVKLKVVLDTIHITVRTVTFTPLIIYWPEGAIIAFSIAQILSNLTYTLGYYIYFYKYIENKKKAVKNHKKNDDADNNEEDDFPFNSIYEFFPRKLNDQFWIDYPLGKLTWSFFKQGIIKQILTEGERYVMAIFAVLTFKEQGCYDLVNNLGSLAARFLFRPIEESSYFYFTQMVKRDEKLNTQNKNVISEMSFVLETLLRTIVSLGLVILVFGQAYSSLLLFLYGGEELLDGPGPQLLRAHCLAILLLAINGITECYAFASMDRHQLDRYNYLMAIFSIIFLVLSWILTGYFGALGFILANCANMTARIIHSIWFIHNQFLGTEFKPLKGLYQSRMFLITIIVIAIVLKYSEMKLFESNKLYHFIIGSFNFIIISIIWIFQEKSLVQLMINKYIRKSK